MEFTFPDQFILLDNRIMKVENKDFLPVDIQKPLENLITIDKIDYYFTPLGEFGNKGGNSIILKLFLAQEFDTEDIEYGNPDRVLKISKVPYKNNPSKYNIRFDREIQALVNCKAKNHQNIITIYNRGMCKIKQRNGKISNYQFYTMEYAESDLKSYIEINHSTLKKDQKLDFCLSLAEGLKELRSLGYYHRDLKPDNIFITTENVWKIGDLGLLADRNEDDLDKIAEFVGPRGWLSPEAMNKYLCEGKGFDYEHDCVIDHQSDIFQLGKIFWYIFQHNAPIGTVKESDFFNRDTRIYSLIKTMLNHSKKKRFKDVDEVIQLLKPLEAKLLKSVS